MVQMKHKLLKGWHLLLMKLGMPARSKTGSTIGFANVKAGSIVLAGELLQMDGRYQEAWEILEPFYENQMFQDDLVMSRD